MTENQKPPEPPERRIEVKNSRGTVIGDFNQVVQNYLADPKMRFFLLGLAALIIISTVVLLVVLPNRGKQDMREALATAILPTTTPAPTATPAPSPTPATMHGKINVAVAEFTLTGGSQEPKLGFDVAEMLKENLETSLVELVGRGEVVLWGPGQIGALDPAEPVKAAREKARAVHAHIIIYGTVDAGQQPVNVTPRFYISDEDVLYDTRELTGEHNLGAAISVSGDPLSAPFNTLLLDGMIPRVHTLTVVIQALSYYSVSKYDQALEVFKRAAPLPEAGSGTPVPTPGIPREGRELIYLLAGNAAGKIGNQAGLDKDFEQAGIYFEQAAHYYDLSLADEPDYARAMIGKAGLLYMRAMNEPMKTDDPAALDTKLLQDAIDLYQKAAAAKYKPEGADVEAKVHFGLGQCYFMQAYSAHANITNQKELDAAIQAFQPAETEFLAVVAAYNGGDADAQFRLRDLAGLSHGRLGLLYLHTQRLDPARAEFEQAVVLLKNSFETQRLAEYQKRLEALKP